MIARAQQDLATARRAKDTKDTRARELREEKSNKPEDIKRVVDRNILRLFGDSVPATVVDVVEVNGLTMRNRMIADRTALLASGRKRADPAYFGEVKKEYLAVLTGQPLVKATSPDEQIPDGLHESIAAAKNPQRRFRKLGPLTHWLETRNTPVPQAWGRYDCGHVGGDPRLQGCQALGRTTFSTTIATHKFWT